MLSPSQAQPALGSLGELASAAGYCDVTASDNAGSCDTDDKGSFAWDRGSSSHSALASCRAQCERCAGCNFLTVSHRWKDCSWFRACDMHALQNDVPGHRTFHVRNATAAAALGAAAEHPALWSLLRSLPPPAAGACRAGPPQCTHARGDRLVLSLPMVGEPCCVDAEAHGVYGGGRF